MVVLVVAAEELVVVVVVVVVAKLHFLEGKGEMDLMLVP